MSFLNLGLAAGALAFTVPLAIHLLFRSRYRSLDWGAMFLLQDVVAKNRKRMQWHQWILLALRCAIPILLALAMARPLLSSVRSLPGSAPLSLVLLIDDSRSMQATGRLDRALHAADGLIDDLSRGDEVILLTTGSTTSGIERSSPREARARLAQIRFDGSPADYAVSLQRCVQACGEASYPNRRVVLCGDFQANSQQTSTKQLDAIERVHDRLSRLTPPPRVDLLQVARDDDALANVLVESVQTEAPAVLVDQPVRLVAKVRNDSEAPISRLLGRWLVDGRAVETMTLDVEPRGTVLAKLEHTFDSPGTHSVSFAIEHTDVLAADNRRRLAIDARQQIRVWLIDGDRSNEPLQSETDFLRIALSPFAFSATDPSTSRRSRRDTVTTRVLPPQKVATELNKVMKVEEDDTAERPDLIVLANIKKPIDRKLMEDYLGTGGHVLFFDGDQVDVEAWEHIDWLPAQLGELITSAEVAAVIEGAVTVSSDDQAKLGFQIQSPGAGQNVWGELAEAGDSIWDEVRIRRYRRWTIAPAAEETAPGTSGERTKILLRTREQAPLVVRRGPVVQFAIGCDSQWSTLPLRMVYLPMMQQLVLDLVGSQTSVNVIAGQPMLIPAISTRWQVTDPNGTSTQWNVGQESTSSRSAVPFAMTSVPGVYRFRDSDDQSILRVAEIPASESDLRALEESQIDVIAERLDARVFADSAALIGATKTDRFGQEIWRFLLWLLLLAMIVELLWQQFAGRPKSSAETWTMPTPINGGSR